jgi:excisionase family DNA binding protein
MTAGIRSEVATIGKNPNRREALACVNSERLMSLQKRFKKSPVVTLPAPHDISGPRLLNIKAAASYLGAHAWAVRQMVRSRQLPHVKIGHGYLIDKLDLDRYIERNKIGIAA